MSFPFLPTNESITLGSYGPPFVRFPLRLPLEQFEANAHVIGLSGSGKSRFLASLFLQLVKLGQGATLLDLHGDLARLVLGKLVEGDELDPARVTYLDLPRAERAGRFLPFNVLKQPYPAHVIGSAVLDALHRAYPELAQGAPAFDNLVKYGVKLLISNRLPLTALKDLLADEEFRRSLYPREEDEEVANYFKLFFDRMDRRLRLEEIDSAMRRLGDLTYSPVLRYSLGQRENVLDLRSAIEAGKATVVDLSLADRQAARLIGCLLTVFAEQAAFSRAELPQEERVRSHWLILDEYGEVSARSDASLTAILSHCRKYRVFVVMAHQTYSQASERLRGSFQNAGLEVCFRLGRLDADYEAEILMRPDVLSVKHQVADPAAVERTHPLYFNLIEQKASWVTAIEDLGVGEAFLRLPGGRIAQVRTPEVPDPAVDSQRLADVEERYLRGHFRPQAQVEAEMARARKARGAGQRSSRTTRVRMLERPALGRPPGPGAEADIGGEAMLATGELSRIRKS